MVMEMVEVVIFCGSYPQIKNALYIATRMHPDAPTSIVVPANRDLFKFFETINERVFHNKLNVVYLRAYRTRRAKATKLMKRIRYLPLDIMGEKRHLKLIYGTYFDGLRGARVFFSSQCFSSYTHYLLRRLSKANTLVYIPDPACDALSIDKSMPKNPADLAALAVMKLTFGHDITVGRLSYTKFPCIPESFMEKEVDEAFTIEERNGMMKDFDLGQFKVSDTSNYRVLYFDQPLVEAGRVDDYDTYKKELTGIFNILGKYFPEQEIARKYHPHYPADKTMIKTGVVLEDFIPAELLYNDNVRLYLGTFSLAIANVEKGSVVSLANLISFKSEVLRDKLKEILIQRSCSRIIFPKSLEEFEQIVAGVSRA